MLLRLPPSFLIAAKGHGLDSKAGILPANIVSCASALEHVSLNDTSDVRKAMDLTLNLVGKARKVVRDNIVVEIVTASIEMNLSSLKALRHKSDKPEILDQARLWEIEQVWTPNLHDDLTEVTVD